MVTLYAQPSIGQGTASIILWKVGYVNPRLRPCLLAGRIRKLASDHATRACAPLQRSPTGRFDMAPAPGHDRGMELPNAYDCPPAVARLLRLLAFGAPPEPAAIAQWPDEEWRAILEAAGRQELSPLLHRRLVDTALPAPEATLARLRRHYLRVAADNTRRFAALEEALLALHGADVRVILLKGAHLAPLVYGNIALRPMVDVDLLVRDHDADKALGALSALGYAPLAGGAWMEDRYGHHALRRNDGLLLELHQRVGALAVGAHVDQAGLWQRAQPTQIGRAAALALAPLDLLLHLCVHGAQQHLLQLGLLPLYDIGQVLARYGAELDWEACIRRAHAWRVARAVYLMLALARRLLDAPVDPGALVALAPPDGEAYVALALGALLQRDREAAAPSSNLVALWSEHRWRARLALCLRILLPNAQRMRALYGVPTDRPVAPWLYLRRWADLLTRREESVRQWLNRPGEGPDWQALVRWLAQG